MRVGPYQFPEIHQRVAALAAAMGLHKPPDVYVFESNTQRWLSLPSRQSQAASTARV